MRFVCDVDLRNFEVIKNRAGEGVGGRAWCVEDTPLIATEESAALQPALRGPCLYQQSKSFPTPNSLNKKVSAIASFPCAVNGRLCRPSRLLSKAFIRGITRCV
jgi:hypothetical protein